MAFNVTFSLNDSACPVVTITDGGSYDNASTNHRQQDMVFTAEHVTMPDGKVFLISTDSGLAMKYDTPHEYVDSLTSVASGYVPYNLTQESGGYTVYRHYVIPAPVVGTTYDIGDTVFYNGEFYECLSSALSLLQIDYLSNTSYFKVIKLDEVVDKYYSEEVIFLECLLEECLNKRIRELNCKILDDPCDDIFCKDEYSFNTVKFFMGFYQVKYVEELDVNNPVVNKLFKDVSNFANNSCCCRC